MVSDDCVDVVQIVGFVILFIDIDNGNFVCLDDGMWVVIRMYIIVDFVGNEIICDQLFNYVEDVSLLVVIIVVMDMMVECDGSGNIIVLSNWLVVQGGVVVMDNGSCSDDVELVWINMLL